MKFYEKPFDPRLTKCSSSLQKPPVASPKKEIIKKQLINIKGILKTSTMENNNTGN